MTVKCSKCHRRAVTFIRYNGTHLCREHFLEYVRRRVKKDIKKQGVIERDSVIGVAISGGKDSLVALHLLHEIFSERRGNKLVAITVDEGIKGYRDESIKFAIENCDELGVQHYMISFKEVVGYTLDEIVSMKDERGPCTYCGVFRRQCLNRKAKELGVSILATGHNLDDMAQSALMNFIKGDIEKIARMGPHTRIQPGLIPRLLPLRTIPEKETTLFAILEGIKYHDGVCPYAEEAFRGVFRDILEDLEYR
ncbi:MAG TPA: tRNA 2-thiocytidine biosynthesis protein TtcA, partial [Thermoplasmatales archaeon]|nr:tRNA 2-thiocytidine biosynthesis protein TtcA [Thermoplasmatales archaeon]